MTPQELPDQDMNIEGIWPALLIVAIVAAWVTAKVVHYAHKSEQQWLDVDKSKLKEWDDDEW